MATKKATVLNIFDDENFSVSGRLPDGPARMESVYYGSYDADGKFTTPAAVLFINFQPLDKDGNDVGEAKLMNYGIGDLDKAIELKNPISGKKGQYSGFDIAEGSEHAKVFGFCDFAFLRNSLKAAAKLTPELVDLDEVAQDITGLDGLVVEIVQFTKPEVPKKVTDDNKKEAAADKSKKAWSFPIITEILDPKKFGKKGGTKKKAVKEEEEEDDAPKSKKGGKGKVTLGDDKDENLALYLDEVLTDDVAGESPVSIRMGAAAWATKHGMDGDDARELQAYLKETFAAQLKSKGWKLVKGLLSNE